ncbi:prepilin-type N-terminal cleavage/methylation domain-containing protein [Pseudoflavonifractor phocaeensis]|uniref:prepilin-type N-terminal cleavage/methylation domain-containing protein n=1 Tax=Pseudoflavonifractor phocaeensis TaxID=1870988 RepID=UPI00210A5746|nr:prepilin-type N-terminal cleavage/methylation domain-containing protein [Pseudoflavonifractor phocaeensis]MCQ4863815.1 prepilin-type N-terminal cleavage/methylation domain-containing protein [Pseudoflavonifractor phocaeensis]
MKTVLANKLRKNKKGFTLAELLVVVAIIAILVAIAIPVFNSATKKAEEAVEVANARSTYAEGMVQFISSGTQKLEKKYNGKTYVFECDDKGESWSVTVNGTKKYDSFDNINIDGDTPTPSPSSK